jgi:hypothetical protein
MNGHSRDALLRLNSSKRSEMYLARKGLQLKTAFHNADLPIVVLNLTR